MACAVGGRTVSVAHRGKDFIALDLDSDLGNDARGCFLDRFHLPFGQKLQAGYGCIVSVVAPFFIHN